jgi:hypothetical protein
MKWLTAIAIALVLAFVPTFAFAEEAGTEDLLLRIGADVHVPQGDSVGSLIVIDGNARIDGEVRDAVLVISGDAVVTGTVQGDLTVISGNIDLRPSASLNNVTSIRGDLVRAEGSSITGTIEERDSFAFFAGVAAVFSILFWLAFTLAVVVAGLIFAAVGGRQLNNAAQAMTSNAVNVIIGIVFVWVAIPVLATVAMITLIGIPLGIGLLLFLLPTLWFLGYIVAGARLGTLVLGIRGRDPGEHPFAATTLGLILLQLAVLVPAIGPLIALLAGAWGAGAIAVNAYRAAGGKGYQATPSQTTPGLAS